MPPLPPDFTDLVIHYNNIAAVRLLFSHSLPNVTRSLRSQANSSQRGMPPGVVFGIVFSIFVVIFCVIMIYLFVK
jgi:hypothetical protein